MKYDLSFSAGVDGTPGGMPDGLHGMSGCPVWMIDPMRQLDSSSLRLVGVQTGTVPLEGAPHIKIVKATKFEGVVAWLVHLFPDLERVLFRSTRVPTCCNSWITAVDGCPYAFRAPTEMTATSGRVVSIHSGVVPFQLP